MYVGSLHPLSTTLWTTLGAHSNAPPVAVLQVARATRGGSALRVKPRGNGGSRARGETLESTYQAPGPPAPCPGAGRWGFSASTRGWRQARPGVGPARRPTFHPHAAHATSNGSRTGPACRARQAARLARLPAAGGPFRAGWEETAC